MITKFLEIIVDVKGNISPQKFNEKYFMKYNNQHLWDWFISQSQNFPNYSPRDVVTLLKYEHTEPPKCIVCGNNAKVQFNNSKNIFSVKYCSNYCSLTSKERRDKLSKSKRAYTQDKIDEINAKREQTNLNKTGYKFNSQRPEVKQILKEKLSKSQLSSLAHEKLHDKEWLDHNYNVLKRTSVDIADEIQSDYSTVLDYCRNYGFEIRKFTNESLPQKQLFEFIKEIYSGDVLYNDWNFLKTLELDIVIPELNLAIEFNGLYYHSSVTTNDRNKHLNKTLLCEEKGINLIHVRSDQWQFQKEIIKSMLKSKLGLLENKLYARKCQIVKLESKLTKTFLKENHIQGSVDSSISYGLMFKNELVSVMTFNKPRFNKNYDWELMRFCNKLDHNIIGAFSKLLKHFRNNHEGSIISYCDRSRSDGNVYYKNGFELVEKKLEPGYFWTDRTKVYNRQHFQKHKLKKLFANNEIKYYNEDESEFDNMIKNGYRIYYDCGNLAFILK